MMNKKTKKAFTLIEVMMSVAIVSIVVLGIMKVQGQNSDMAAYIISRGNSEFDNSLFLTKRVERYDNDEKNAYDILVDEFSIKDLEGRDILKKLKKKIHITDEVSIPVGGEDEDSLNFVFYSKEILLKGKYPGRYYTYK